MAGLGAFLYLAASDRVIGSHIVSEFGAYAVRMSKISVHVILILI